MAHHNSKARKSRFWEIWQANGSIQPKKVQAESFIPTFISIPPPDPKVTRVVNATITLLCNLEIQVRKVFTTDEYMSETCNRKLSKLLGWIVAARYQAHLCEHLIAREYLTRVYSETDEHLKPFAPQLSRIIRNLRWCEENDRRPMVTWAPLTKAA